MRKELERLGTDKRYRFRARVSDFGARRTCFGMYTVNMILLTDISLVENGKRVTDHVWFTAGKIWKGFEKGTVVEFDARVAEYVKGYKRSVFDYKLSHPTKIANCVSTQDGYKSDDTVLAAN